MEFQSSIYALSTGWIASGEGPGLYCRSCWCIKFLVWLSEWGIAINCWISRICLHSHNHCTRILVRSFSSLQEQMYLVPTRHRGQVFSYHKHIPTFWNWFVEINFYIKKNNGVSNTILIKHSRIPVFVHFENILQKLFFPSPLSKRSVGTYATFRLTILEISFRIAWYLYQKSHSSTWSTYLK